MYAAARDLPVDEGADDEFSVPKRDSSQLSEVLRAKLGGYDGFWEIWDPFEQERAVSSSVAHDLAEIYEDLREALDLLDRYGAESGVLWDVRWAFAHHWGKHLVDVLRPIYQLNHGWEGSVLDADAPQSREPDLSRATYKEELSHIGPDWGAIALVTSVITVLALAAIGLVWLIWLLVSQIT